MAQMIVELPEETEALGPCMKAISEQQRAYVIALCTTGCSEVQAALAAGYGSTSATHEAKMNTANQAVWRFRRMPSMIDAQREEVEKRLNSGVALAANALLAMVLDPGNKHHYKAVDRLLGQAGMVVATKHEVSVTHKEERRTDKEILDRIHALADKHGIDIARLLPAPAVDAEFTVVQDGGSTAGLEDLL